MSIIGKNMGTTKKNNAKVYEHNGLTLDDIIIYNYEVRHNVA